MWCKEEGKCLVRRKDSRCVVRLKKTFRCGKEKWILCCVVKNKESVLFSEKERAFCVSGGRKVCCMKRKGSVLCRKRICVM